MLAGEYTKLLDSEYEDGTMLITTFSGAVLDHVKGVIGAFCIASAVSVNWNIMSGIVIGTEAQCS